MKQADPKLSRRHLLQLAAAGTAVLGTGCGGMAGKGGTAAQAQNAAKPQQLHDLVDKMIDIDYPGRMYRIYFDVNATDLIKQYKLTQDQWETLIRFEATGENIKNKGAKELEDNDGKPAADKWVKKFDQFKTDWACVVDGYVKPYPDCVSHEGGTGCHKTLSSDELKVLYSYPVPKIDDVQPVGDGRYFVRGEGMLNDAVVRIYDAPTAGKLVLQATNGAYGTFRCSRFTFDPKGLDASKKYYLEVVNRIDGVEAKKPIEPGRIGFQMSKAAHSSRRHR